MNARTLADASSAPHVREASTISFTCLALLFVVGDVVLLTRPNVQACTILLALLSCTTACLLWRRGVAWIGMGCLTSGAAYAWLATSEQLNLRWPESRAGERVLAEVVVDTIPVAGPLGWSFDASVQTQTSQHARSFRGRVRWTDHNARPRSGDRWQLVISLQPPRAPLNPSGLDRELQYFRERINTVGTVVDSRLNVRLDAGHRPLTALRERIVDRIRERVPDRDAAALISALAVGHVGEMSREQWRVFNATGTTHLVAISGLHVTLFAVLALHAARLTWRWGVWRVARVPREVFAAFTAIFASTAYALLAGFSVPTQRTLVMLTVWLLVRASARACSPFAPLSLALAAVLMLDPFAPLASGFWLSFMAIGAIILVTNGRWMRQGVLREALSVQLAVSLTLASVTLAWFDSLSLAGLVVNIAAIPLISFVFVPLILLAVVLMSAGEVVYGALLDCAEWLYRMGWPWLAGAAEWPMALIYASPPGWWYVAAMVAAGVALMPWPLRLRLASLAWLVPAASAGTAAPQAGEMELALLDVGQGTAAVIRTANHVLVYETGDVWGSQGGPAERALVPFLRQHGVSAIHRVVISHVTHHGSPGLTTLLAAFPVESVLIGGLKQRDLDHARSCVKDEAWLWDGIRFEILHPPAFALRPDADRSSAPSCVMRITGKGGKVLLPGDIDSAGERLLVEGGLGQVDVVVIPRHGANTASSSEIIAATGASWALLSGQRCGRGSEKPAVRRWRASGAKVLATGDNGAVRLTIDPVHGVRAPLAQRELQPALWRSPSAPARDCTS